MIFKNDMKVRILYRESKDSALVYKGTSEDFDGEFYIRFLIVGKAVYLTRDKGQKIMSLSNLKSYSIEEDILTLETRNRIYKMEILDKGIEGILN